MLERLFLAVWLSIPAGWVMQAFVVILCPRLSRTGASHAEANYRGRGPDRDPDPPRSTL